MLKDIQAVYAATVAYSKEEVLPVIWNIKNIEYCEVKADTVEVTRVTDRTGTYNVKGHFARLVPWSRTFEYALHDRGFHSKETEKSRSSLNVSGGFIVEEASDNRCLIIHYEQYTLPWYFLPLKPLITIYLKWSQAREMRDLTTLIHKTTNHQPALSATSAPSGAVE